MKIYILGASGFIGQHLSSALSSSGYKVIAVSRQTLNLANIECLQLKHYSELAAENDSICIHLAENSKISATDENLAKQQSLVVESLLNNPFQKIIYASSAAVYGDQSDKAHSEEEALSAIINPYVKGKLLNEKKVSEDSRANIVIRFGNIFGLNMPAASVIQTIFRQLDSGQSKLKLMSLKPVRDYLYIMDAIEAIKALLNLKAAKGIYNIASGSGHSVADLLSIISDLHPHKQFSVEQLETKDLVSKLILDVSKLKSETGWRPEYDLRAGLERMLRNRL